MKKNILLILVCLLSFNLAFSQDRIITGKVTSASDGLPLPGVSVTVKGVSTIGTQTNAQGNYKLSVPGTATALIFQYIGFTRSEIPITGDLVNNQLQEDQTQLSEVVVTGYSTQTNREITGSIATVKNEEFSQVPIASFDQALQGKAAGTLVLANSGQPGAAASVLIRGSGSIIGSNTPLYISDGIEITADDFSTLNPSDFESISILKDASSTSQYGSRGANGVIVITTKKGKAGATRFTYDAQFGKSTLPESKLILMNSDQKLDYELANGNPYEWTDEDVAALRLVNTDWEDVFYRTGETASHVLSVSGGNEKTTFFLSGSFFDQTGTVETTGLKRTTGRANIDSKAGNFNFGINSTFGYSDFTNTSESNTGIATPLNAARWLNPYESVYDEDGNYTQITSGQPHALQELLENSNNRNQLKGVGNIYLSYKAPFLEGLTLSTNLGGDFRNNEGTTYIDPTTFLGAGSTGGEGSFGRSIDRYFRYTSTSSAIYSKTINSDHNFSVGIYNEIIKRNNAAFNFTGYGLGGAFENEAGITPGNATNGFTPAVGGTGSINALLSYFADAKYSFKNRYFIQTSIRRDGSSRFGENRKYANFGSIGGSWIISDENFMSTLKQGFLNELKFKISYGSAGNQEGIGNFQSRELYARSVYNGVSGLVQTQLSNPELQWERKATFNTGLEFTIFRGRLGGTVEYYNSLTSDLFLNRQLSRTTGYSFLASNIGELQNRGIEASLNTDVLKSKNFNWAVNASFTYNKNEVKKLVGDQQEIIGDITINRIGESVNSLFVVPTAGVNPDNGAQQYLAIDGSITESYDAADRVIAGSTQIPYFGGFGTIFTFKGLELNTFFSFSTGNKIYNNDRNNVENPSYYFDNLSADILREWRNPGDITDIPSPGDTYEDNTTRFVESGNFLRFRNATLSYSLPKQLIERAKLSNVRLFVQGQNIYTWTKFKGYDPELSGGVNTGAVYPALRTFTFGLNFGL